MKEQSIDLKKIRIPVKAPVYVAAAIAVIALLSTTLYQVAPDEVGVVRRFGKYARTTLPGLRAKLPFGMETVVKVRIRHIFKEEFGFRTKEAGIQTTYMSAQDFMGKLSRSNIAYQRKAGFAADPFLAESLMLTGDLNCAEVEWIIQYQVNDPEDYVFNVRDVRGTVLNMCEAVMRQVVGDSSVDEVITFGKANIQEIGKQKLQEVLDEFKIGIKITNLVLQDVNPPREVKDSFDDVNRARQDKDRFKNQAWEKYNEVIPKARGEAEKAVKTAEGYQIERINRARGDAARFIATWKAYKEAKNVTRRRLYLETMAEILPAMERKVIIDEEQKGVLPFLDIMREGGEGK